jgi:hypothetical protein
MLVKQGPSAVQSLGELQFRQVKEKRWLLFGWRKIVGGKAIDVGAIGHFA